MRNSTQSSQGGLWIAGAALALALSGPAQAGVEFVTRENGCEQVDAIGDGRDLFVIAGPDVRFRVFGSGISTSSAVRIAVDSGVGTVTVTRPSTANFGVGVDCGSTFELIELDSSVDSTSNLQRSLFFRLFLNDESRLQVTIKPYPEFNVVWQSSTSSLGCIVKTGTFEKLNQNEKIKITLPAGHLQDQTNCFETTLVAKITPADMGELDIFGPPIQLHGVRPALVPEGSRDPGLQSQVGSRGPLHSGRRQDPGLDLHQQQHPHVSLAETPTGPPP